MELKKRTIRDLATMICGNGSSEDTVFVYRTSSALTQFFQEDCETDFEHDGTTRDAWVMGVLREILFERWPNPQTPPDAFARVIQALMDLSLARNESEEGRPKALAQLNTSLARDGFEAFYAPDKKCYLKHTATNTVSTPAINPHRALSAAELLRREQLTAYLEEASEDELIADVLVPLFRQLGFHRVTVAGHKDKALEYGKDLWMKFTLPTMHVLYFGIQAKKGKIDSAGVSKSGSENVAEILNQVRMMLGHEVFDHDTGKRVLVDHAFIVAGGEITKAARNWLGGQLDASKRSQIMFMDRDDLLNLYVVTSLPLPRGAVPESPSNEDDLFVF
jgi:hypothetical protein